MACSMGRQSPAAACLVTVGSSRRKNPCLHTASWASSCSGTSWGLSAAEEGREELHMQGGAGDKRLGYCWVRLCRASPCITFCLFSRAQALGSNRHYRFLKACGMEAMLGRRVGQ